MTYQGERARPLPSERGRCFEVSKVRVGADGEVSNVLWCEVDAASDRDVGEPAWSSAAEVVDALHDGARVAAVFPRSSARLPDREFEVVAREGGAERIALAGAASPGRELGDLDEGGSGGPDARDGLPAGREPAGPRERPALPRRGPAPAAPTAGGKATFAVSRVRLDEGGRVTDVVWGRVDTRKNAWASPEATAPVADVVQALDAGHRVFALFPSAHGHLPHRRFVSVDYDDGRRTVALDGPATHEREIHGMDRLA